MFTFLSANSKSYKKVNSQCCSKKCCTLRHSGTVCFLYLIPETSYNKMITLNQTRNICPYYIYEHVIILLWIPIGHRTKDQSLQSWPLVFQYPPCLERDQKYPVSFLSLIIWYILFNTVILPLHVNISAGFRGQVTRKKKSLRSFNSVLAQTLLENRSKVF